jgi:hypothetical protein
MFALVMNLGVPLCAFDRDEIAHVAAEHMDHVKINPTGLGRPVLTISLLPML